MVFISVDRINCSIDSQQVSIQEIKLAVDRICLFSPFIARAGMFDKFQLELRSRDHEGQSKTPTQIFANQHLVAFKAWAVAMSCWHHQATSIFHQLRETYSFQEAFYMMMWSEVALNLSPKTFHANRMPPKSPLLLHSTVYSLHIAQTFAHCFNIIKSARSISSKLLFVPEDNSVSKMVMLI